jgi:hypothetical protein
MEARLLLMRLEQIDRARVDDERSVLLDDVDTFLRALVGLAAPADVTAEVSG